MDSVRIEIAFKGGVVYGALVPVATADALQQALDAGTSGSYSFDTDEGRITVVLGQIVYLKRFARDARVGFRA